VSLMDFDAGRARAITIYADTRAHDGASRPMAEVVTALDAVEASLADSAERADAFRESRRRAEAVLADPAAHAGDGLAAFVCESRGLLEVFALPTPFHTRVAVGRRLYIPPLARLLETFDSHIVAHVRSDRAEIYTAYLHRLWPAVEIASDVPGRASGGGWAQARLQRHREERVKKHLKLVADEIARLVVEEEADRVLLFGPGEVMDALPKHLPDAVAQRVLAREPMPNEAGEAEIRERARDILHRYRDGVAADTIGELEGRIGSGGRGAAGVGPVVEALNRRAADALVLSRSLAVEGFRCAGCGWLQESDGSSCPTCGGELRPGLLARLMAQAARGQGASVLFVEDSARMAPFGGVAAFLRF